MKEDVSSNTIIKSSTQRLIRTKLIQQFPILSQSIETNSDTPIDSIITLPSSLSTSKSHSIQPQEDPSNLPSTDQDPPPSNSPPSILLLELIWPKKETLNLLKCREHISILVCKGTPLFFQHFDGPYFPTLKLLHQYPLLLPHVQVDRGAIKFVLSGANVMCPGLTSPGAKLPTDLAIHTPVAVHAEGKEFACAIGFTQKTSQDIIKINKGIGLDNLHWLGDDLWLIDQV